MNNSLEPFKFFCCSIIFLIKYSFFYFLPLKGLNFFSEIWNASWICVPSLCGSHANFLSFVPVLVYVLPKWALRLLLICLSGYFCPFQSNHYIEAGLVFQKFESVYVTLLVVVFQRIFIVLRTNTIHLFIQQWTNMYWIPATFWALSEALAIILRKLWHLLASVAAFHGSLHFSHIAPFFSSGSCGVLSWLRAFIYSFLSASN